MAIQIQCSNPACATHFRVGNHLSGRGVKCNKCGTTFKAIATIEGRLSDTKRNDSSAVGTIFSAFPAEFGRYRILKLLGKGGMGAVYLAQDSQLGRMVAIKIPSFDPSETKRVERFIREAKSAALLSHANTCTVFDTGTIAGRPFITMAYVEGTTLDDAIDPDKPMAQDRAARIACKIAEAIAEAHERGIVHRDLKPTNVMLTPKGEPIVMDFGLAKRVSEIDPAEAKLTSDGTVLGTPSYMAPEQVRGEINKIGPGTDIHALGAMLFEMLTGRTPYIGPVGMVMAQIVTAPVPPVSEFRQDVDPRLDALCQKALAKEPKDRPASMNEFVAALQAVLHSPTEEIIVRKPMSRSATQRPRRPLLIGAAMAAIVLVAGVIGYVTRPNKGTTAAAAGETSATEQDQKKTQVNGERGESSPRVALETVDLFDGKSLEGWTSPEDKKWVWRAENSAIVGEWEGGGDHSTLTTRKQFNDFSLSLEYQLEPRTQAAVVFRVVNEDLDPKRQLVRAIRLTSDDESAGLSGGNLLRTGTLLLTKEYPPNARAPLLPNEQWNKLVVDVRGANVTCYINHVLVQSADLQALVSAGEPATMQRPRASIGLSIRRGKARFRALHIAEHPKSGIKDEVSWTSMPITRGLLGWDDPDSAWEGADETLTLQGLPKKESCLHFKKVFKNYEIRFKVQMIGPGKVYVDARSQAVRQGRLYYHGAWLGDELWGCAVYQLPENKPNVVTYETTTPNDQVDWVRKNDYNQVHMRVVDDRVSFYINDYLCFDMLMPNCPSSGGFGMFPWKTVPSRATFREFEYRELDDAGLPVGVAKARPTPTSIDP